MHTIRLNSFVNKLNIKALLFAFAAVVFLPACGIKGDLYQTPEQGASEEKTATADANKEPVDEVSKVDNSKEEVLKPSTEKAKEQ